MFSRWIDQLPQSDQSSIRTIYKFLPLEQHPWAMKAAEIADCTNQRSAPTFWKLHNFYLSHQREIAASSIVSQSRDFLSAESQADADWIMSCVENGGGQANVQRDLQLAKQLNIHSTPTVILNGRLLNLTSAEDLEASVRSMLVSKDRELPRGKE
jgi:protein-disulfide isomerase